MENQKKLNIKKVYVNESLCKPYRRLFGLCNSLFRNKVLKSNHCFNGKIIAELPNGTKKVIGHLDDLVKLVGHETVKKEMDAHKRKYDA